MELLTPRPQMTTLLTNSVLDRLQRLRIRPAGKRTSRSRGEHLSGKGGTSTEFCDYRDYTPGDDTRFVDWNIFARLHRPYLKQFHKEEERHVVLLIDASASMKFEDKLNLAKPLAAAFGVMGLLNNERVSAYASHQAGDAPDRLPPCRGRASLRTLFQFIESVEGRGDATLDRAVGNAPAPSQRSRRVRDRFGLPDIWRSQAQLQYALCRRTRTDGNSNFKPARNRAGRDERFAAGGFRNGGDAGHFVERRPAESLPGISAGIGKRSRAVVPAAVGPVPAGQLGDAGGIGAVRSTAAKGVDRMNNAMKHPTFNIQHRTPNFYGGARHSVRAVRSSGSGAHGVTRPTCQRSRLNV